MPQPNVKISHFYLTWLPRNKIVYLLCVYYVKIQQKFNNTCKAFLIVLMLATVPDDWTKLLWSCLADC